MKKSSSAKDSKHSIHTLHKAVSALIVAVLVIGVAGVSTAATQASKSFQASVVAANGLQAKRKVLSYLQKKNVVAQADPEVIKCTDVASDPATYKGEFIARSVDYTASAEQQIKVSVYLKNTGTTPWISDASGCVGKPIMRLGTAKSQDHASAFYTAQDAAWRGSNRIAMKEARIEPNEIATFTFVITAPKQDDIYKEYFQPVIEGVKWMEGPETTQAITVSVGPTNEDILRRSLLLGFSGRASALDMSQPLVVDVNLTTQHVYVKLGDTILRDYLVSTGAYNTPTPPGRFKILQKNELRIGVKSPHYRMPHFQLLTPKGVGFHALPYLANDSGVFWKEALNHIGRRVSHGCVRMLPEDAQDLFNITDIGTTVVIHYGNPAAPLVARN